VGAQLYEADAISSLASLPMNASYEFIVGYVRSIAVRLTKIPDQKLLTPRWRSIDAPLTLIPGHGNSHVINIIV